MNDYKGDKPRPKDKVRVTFDAEYVEEADSYTVVDVADGMGPIHLQVPAWASVEVLERADDPSEDLPGTIRRWDRENDPTQSAAIGDLVIKWHDDELCWVWFRWDGPQLLSNAAVVGMPVVGALFGAPAAEAEKPDPRDVPGPRCNAIEGATGINCRLARLHGKDVEHEGWHEPAGERDSVGYRLFVRWPWNEWDRDAVAVGAMEEPLPDWEQEATRKQVRP